MHTRIFIQYQVFATISPAKITVVICVRVTKCELLWCTGTNIARALSSLPPNILNPAAYTELVKTMAEHHKWQYEEWTPAELQDMGKNERLSVKYSLMFVCLFVCLVSWFGDALGFCSSIAKEPSVSVLCDNFPCAMTARIPAFARFLLLLNSLTWQRLRGIFRSNSRQWSSA